MTVRRQLVEGAGRLARRWWGPVALVAAWQCWIWLRNVPRVVAPPPLEVAGELADPGWLLGPLLSTLWLTVLGVILGLGAGVSFAVACWWFSSTRLLIIPPALLAQTIPLVVLIPILGRLLGFGTPSVIAIAGIIGFFPSLVFVDSGLSSVPQARHELVQVLGASRFRYLLHVALPTSIPRLSVAIRLTASLAFLGSVTAEYLVGSSGLGRLIAQTGFFLQQTEENRRQMPLMESPLTGAKGLFQMSLEDIAGPQYQALRRAGVHPLPDVKSFVTLDVLDAAYQGKTSLLR